MKPLKMSRKTQNNLKRLETHSPTERLADPNFIAVALVQCMLEGDEETFKDLIKEHFEAVNITKALKRAHVSQRTFFEAVSKKGNPRLSTIMKIVRAIGYDSEGGLMGLTQTAR